MIFPPIPSTFLLPQLSPEKYRAVSANQPEIGPVHQAHQGKTSSRCIFFRFKFSLTTLFLFRIALAILLILQFSLCSISIFLHTTSVRLDRRSIFFVRFVIIFRRRRSYDWLYTTETSYAVATFLSSIDRTYLSVRPYNVSYAKFVRKRIGREPRACRFQMV